MEKYEGSAAEFDLKVTNACKVLIETLELNKISPDIGLCAMMSIVATQLAGSNVEDQAIDIIYDNGKLFCKGLKTEKKASE